MNSTFIQQLLDDKVISSRSYGLSYNTTSYAGGPDSIVLGGIDKSRIQGPLFNSSIVSQKALLQVEIVGITITMPDLKGGTSVKDLLSGSALKNITAVLDNTIDQILFPVWLVEIYREMVNAEWYTGSTLDGFNTPGIYPSRFLDQNGSSNNNMTIKLSNGFETTIPASLLTQRVSDTADSPQNRTISNILETLSGSDIAILGALFLSQTYLSVDYDSMSFSLAGRAAEESAADLQQFPCADISDPTASKTTVDIINNDNTAATSGFNSDSNGVKVSRSSPNKFLGPILGSLLGTAAVLALILVLLRRRRNRLKAEAIAVRPRSMGEKETLGYKLTSTTSRASWVETEGLRMDMDEKRALAMRAPVSLMSSRVSLGARGSFGPSRSGTPIRNSYFTEDLDGTGTRPRQPSY